MAHHVTEAAGRPRRGARVLRPAARRRRSLRRAAARPAVHARWSAMSSSARRRAAASRTTTRSTSASPVPSRSRPRPGRLRLLDVVSAYLPLLMMAVLASGTWWLVRNAPSVDTPREAAPLAPRGRLRDDALRRPALRQRRRPAHRRSKASGCATIPDDDTLEIDQARIRAIGDDGVVTRRECPQGARQRRRQRGPAARRCARRPAGARQGRADRVPRRVPARVPQRRAIALAPAGGRHPGPERRSRRRHGVRQPVARRRPQGSDERDLHAAPARDERAGAARRARRMASAARMTAPLVFITGASSGIGQALAARFQRAGYRLALVARRADEVARWATAQGFDAATLGRLRRRRPRRRRDHRRRSRLHRRAGRSRCRHRQRRHQHRHGHGGARRPRGHARDLRDQQPRPGGDVPSLRRGDDRAAAAARWSASPASPASAACPATARTRRARRG